MLHELSNKANSYFALKRQQKQWRRSQVKSGDKYWEEWRVGSGEGLCPPQLGVWRLAPSPKKNCAENYAILSKFWYFFPILQHKNFQRIRESGGIIPSPKSGGPIPLPPPPCSDAYEQRTAIGTAERCRKPAVQYSGRLMMMDSITEQIDSDRMENGLWCTPTAHKLYSTSLAAYNSVTSQHDTSHGRSGDRSLLTNSAKTPTLMIECPTKNTLQYRSHCRRAWTQTPATITCVLRIC